MSLIRRFMPYLQRFQKQMKGEAAKAGFFSEDDVADWITNGRREEAAE